MKAKLLILLLASLLGTALSAQEWSSAITVREGNTPDLDIDPETGNLYIINHHYGVYYTKMSPQGEILLQESIPAAALDRSGRYQFGAAIAYDPVTGEPHVCYRVERGNGSWYFDVYYIRRKPGGGWTSPIKLIDNRYRAYKVRLEVDRAGKAHVVVGYSDGNDDIFGRAIYFRIANDKIDRTIENLHRYRADDHLEISLGKDDSINIVLSSPDRSYRGSAGGPVTYHRSFDGGETLEKVGDIRDNDATDRTGNADIYADPAGNVHFSYGTKFDKSLDANNIDMAHSVRYARFEDGRKVLDRAVSVRGEIGEWAHSLGKGSVAATDDGQTVMLLYNVADEDALRARYSTDGGKTWSDYAELASKSGGADGREKHVVRAWKNTFFAVYPSFGKVYMRKFIAGVPPTAVAGGPYTGNEGQALKFDASASSSSDGQPLAEYNWDWDGDGTFDTSTANATIMHTYADDFSGTVLLEVVDAGGLRDTTEVNVTINNVAPTVTIQAPASVALDSNITFTAQVTDPGQDNITVSWDLDDDGTFETTGMSVNTTFAQAGVKTVRVRASDDDGGQSEAKTTVTVSGGAPVISAIPGQEIQEGGIFTPITLNDFVTDPDHDKTQLAWRFFGNRELKVTIENAVATVAVPDSEWAGAENISFVASDPLGNADTTVTRFSVLPVNDPPQLSEVPDQQIDHGGRFEDIDFAQYVSDIDDPLSALSLRARGNSNLLVSITGLVASVTPADTAWTGTESITFVVVDSAGASASTEVSFTITGTTGVDVADGLIPDAFSLRASYPNPFNPQTTIPFDLKTSAHVQLAIYSIEGRLVATLLDQSMSAGRHRITWDAADLASGTYIVRFLVRSRDRILYSATGKMTVLR